jgi:2-methylcitrate dehydratase PrpD
MLPDIVAHLQRDDGGAETERDAALHELTNALADGLNALADPGIAGMLGPHARGATLAHGARVPGTSFELNPPMAAFNIGAAQTCVDVAALLAVGDFLARRAHHDGRAPLRVDDLLAALARGRRLCALLAEEHAGGATLAATTAVLAQLLGGRGPQIAAAFAAAWEHDVPGEPACGIAGSRRAGSAAGSAVHWAWDAVHRDVPRDDGTRRVRARARARHTEASAARAPWRAASALGRDPADIDGIEKKFAASVAAHFPPVQAEHILARFAARAALKQTPLDEVMAILVKNG